MSPKSTPRTRRPIRCAASCALISCLVGLAALAGCRPQTGATTTAAAPTLTLVVSGDTQGWIMPCGCTSNQSGGLARRGSYINRARRDGEVIVADVGGAPSGTSRYDRVKFAAILHGEVAMGLAAHNLGAAELALGPDELRRLAKETSAPFVSANATNKTGDRLAPESRTVETAGRRVTLIGVVSPRFATQEILVNEPRDAVLAAIAALGTGRDAIVVLAYLPTEELEALAAALPEVDLVVGGPTRQSISPRMVGPRTLLAAVTNKGKFLARFDIPPAGATEPWTGQIIDVDRSLPDDPSQVANLERYRQELTRLDLSAAETGFAAPLSAAGAAYQVAGVGACRECHQDDCQVWDQTAHAAAWQTLVRDRWEVDSDCQRCHTTSYGFPGGFVSARRSTDRLAVGCESCHGPSQAHAKEPTRRRTTFVAKDQCQSCHDRENSPSFAFDKYWSEIAHGLSAVAEKTAPPPAANEVSP